MTAPPAPVPPPAAATAALLLAATAAHASILGPQLPDLPAVPFVERYLFESPLMGAGACTLAGLACWVILRRRGRPRPALAAAAACLLAAAAIWLTSALVTTDRERVRAASRRLVRATAEANTTELRLLLDPDARAATAVASPRGADRIISLVETWIPQAQIRSASVPEVRAAVIEPDAITTQVRVRLDSDLAPRASWWRVEWQRAGPPEGDRPGWVVTHIEPLWIPGVRSPAG